MDWTKLFSHFKEKNRYSLYRYSARFSKLAEKKRI